VATTSFVDAGRLGFGSAANSRHATQAPIWVPPCFERPMTCLRAREGFSQLERRRLCDRRRLELTPCILGSSNRTRCRTSVAGSRCSIGFGPTSGIRFTSRMRASNSASIAFVSASRRAAPLLPIRFGPRRLRPRCSRSSPLRTLKCGVYACALSHVGFRVRSGRRWIRHLQGASAPDREATPALLVSLNA